MLFRQKQRDGVNGVLLEVVEFIWQPLLSLFQQSVISAVGELRILAMLGRRRPEPRPVNIYSLLEFSNVASPNYFLGKII